MNQTASRPAPDRDGVPASKVWLPHGRWDSLLAFLAERFPDVGKDTWWQRLAQGRVLDANGHPLAPDAPAVPGLPVYYFRELCDEAVIPMQEEILYQDDHLLVADKPHFLPVTPAGRFVNETLLVRLRRRTGLTTLVPIHRLDRETAGLVLFSADPRSRGHYQALFREQRLEKTYEALAAPAAGLDFPLVRESRIVRGERFFTMREEPGATPNAKTVIDVIARHAQHWHYRLRPATGKTHQLRVHMLALGIPICNDLLYPVVHPVGADAYDRPLKLLARSLAFTDPLTGQARMFESGRKL